MKKKIIHIILLLLPILMLTTVWLIYAVNIPHWDDHALKAFQVKFNNNPSIIGKIQLIFAQHNEHIIAFTRFLTWIIYSVKGTIDYRWLMFFGNLSLLVIAFLFYIVTKKYGFHLWQFIPVTWLLFGLQLHENLFWGMASVQNFCVVFWLMLSLYLLIVSAYKWAIHLAIFTLFLTIFTSGNGVLLPAIGTICLVIQRRYKVLIRWLIASSIFIFLYFWHYEPAPDSSLTQIQAFDVQSFFKGVMIYFGAVLDIVHVSSARRLDLAELLGLFLFLFSLLFFREVVFKKYSISIKNLDLYLLSIIGFIFGTALLVVHGRLGYGMGVLMTSKYKIYSTLFCIICYVGVLKYFSVKMGNYFSIGAIFIAILFNAYTYYTEFPKVVMTRQTRICDEFNWTYNPQFLVDSNQTKEILKVFRPEQEFYKKNLPTILVKVDTTEKGKVNFTVTKDSSTYRIKINILQTNDRVCFQNEEFYLLLNSGVNHYLYPAEFYYLHRKGYRSQPVEVIIPRNSIVSGIFQVGILNSINGEAHSEYFNQLVDIKQIKSVEVKKNW